MNRQERQGAIRRLVREQPIATQVRARRSAATRPGRPRRRADHRPRRHPRARARQDARRHGRLVYSLPEDAGRPTSARASAESRSRVESSANLVLVTTPYGFATRCARRSTGWSPAILGSRGREHDPDRRPRGSRRNGAAGRAPRVTSRRRCVNLRTSGRASGRSARPLPHARDRPRPGSELEAMLDLADELKRQLRMRESRIACWKAAHSACSSAALDPHARLADVAMTQLGGPGRPAGGGASACSGESIGDTARVLRATSTASAVPTGPQAEVGRSCGRDRVRAGRQRADRRRASRCRRSPTS